MIALHRQYVRPLFIENLSDESKQTSGIDETLLFSSELDLDGALRKVNAFEMIAINEIFYYSSIPFYVIVICILIMV